jgi:hypothetical protein
VEEMGNTKGEVLFLPPVYHAFYWRDVKFHEIADNSEENSRPCVLTRAAQPSKSAESGGDWQFLFLTTK